MNLFQLILAVMLVVPAASADTLKVFTDRPKEPLEKVLAAFTAKTGTQVELVSAPFADLKARIQAGEAVDVLLLKDLTTLTQAASEELFTPMNERNRGANVAPYMRDSDGLWTALSYRIRTFVYDSSALEASSFTTYEALGGAEFAGQLCIRNAKEYMPPMVAWLIVRYGEAKAQSIVEGWKANLAAGFSDNDTQTLKNIEAGVCTVGISNHYYLARMKNADQRLSVEIAFAEQNDGGMHTNGFGGGLVKGTTKSSTANSLLGYLLTPEGQGLLIEAPSFEYPAVKTLKPVQIVENFGTFKASELSWSEVGGKVSKANEILERVGWAK